MKRSNSLKFKWVAAVACAVVLFAHSNLFAHEEH